MSAPAAEVLSGMRLPLQWIEFDLDQTPPRARCVIYRPTAYEDIKPQGTSFASSLPASSARMFPVVCTRL